jgi:hypothetical protein
MTYELNKSLETSTVPLYCKELDTCFFITAIQASQISEELADLIKTSMQSVFESLVSGRKTLIFDCRDFEDEENPLDVAEILDELKQASTTQIDNTVKNN